MAVVMIILGIIVLSVLLAFLFGGMTAERSRQKPPPQDQSTWADTGLPRPQDPKNPRSKR